jgi:hypothetical protein
MLRRIAARAPLQPAAGAWRWDGTGTGRRWRRAFGYRAELRGGRLDLRFGRGRRCQAVARDGAALRQANWIMDRQRN